MRVHGVDIPKPITEFTHCNFNATLTSNVQAVGYNIPTPIQMQVLPAALRHRDIIACAQTGSGKTAAFLLPIIASLCGGGRVGYNPCLPKAIVLAPTRELCMQIEDQAKQLMKGIPMMKTALIVGGLPMPPQIHRLQQGIQLVIATPGRLIDIIDKYVFDFSAIKCFVLDEVDTMLQMGFESQVRQITSLLPQTKQTLMFSATIPEATEKLAETMLKNPVLIAVGKPSSPSSGLKHTVLWVEEKSKKKQLFSLLSDPTYFKPPVVVFVDSKVGADLLTDALCTKCGIAAVAIHGDKSQEERSEALKSVQECRCDAIVATGLLGRGLDLVHVTQVIHFDMPSTIEEFIHQTGRAGRLGSHGSSITFINNTNKNLFLDIVTTLCPLSAVLPSQLLNSPHLIQQKTKQKRKRIVTEDTQGDRHKSQKGDVVTSDNLMQLLRDSKWRRRHRKSRIL
ncbi:probable ATP-dependent RNA helicase DDX59 [Corticium candelabrum]|uniref:probable ATP-dependent RNA helicase DDX59 n=1 Tax=Corticium candelabrum TaxID=121492 RepID=UPI002E256542|nr:probable ATP-dependent RNA helicase DDX59 [Corticium candelabrum]